MQKQNNAETEDYIEAIYEMGLSSSVSGSTLEKVHSSLLIWKGLIENNVSLLNSHYDDV